MRAAVLLAVVCMAVVCRQAEAGWFGTAFSMVNKAIRSITGIMDATGRKKRRQLSEELDAETMKQVDNVCRKDHLKELTPDGLPYMDITRMMESVDKKGKDALDGSEIDELVNLLEVFKHCMTLEN